MMIVNKTFVSNILVLIILSLVFIFVSPRVSFGDNTWSSSHETGDLTDWWKDQSGEAVFNTGNADVSVTDEVAHSGRYSLKKEVWGIDARVTATRIFRWAEHLTEGYFSCWYMFPILPEVDGWLNVFQFKKKNYHTGQVDPTWYNEIKNKAEGTVLTLTHWEQEWDIPANVNDPIPLEANKWFHIEWYYKDGVSDGELKIWQDGVLIWELGNVNTRGIDPDIQWAPSLYGVDVIPGNLVMYVDDCAISTERVGSFENLDRSPPNSPTGLTIIN